MRSENLALGVVAGTPILHLPAWLVFDFLSEAMTKQSKKGDIANTVLANSVNLIKVVLGPDDGNAAGSICCF